MSVLLAPQSLIESWLALGGFYLCSSAEDMLATLLLFACTQAHTGRHTHMLTRKRIQTDAQTLTAKSDKQKNMNARTRACTQMMEYTNCTSRERLRKIEREAERKMIYQKDLKELTKEHVHADQGRGGGRWTQTRKMFSSTQTHDRNTTTTKHTERRR